MPHECVIRLVYTEFVLFEGERRFLVLDSAILKILSLCSMKRTLGMLLSGRVAWLPLAQ